MSELRTAACDGRITTPSHHKRPHRKELNGTDSKHNDPFRQPDASIFSTNIDLPDYFRKYPFPSINTANLPVSIVEAAIDIYMSAQIPNRLIPDHVHKNKRNKNGSFRLVRLEKRRNKAKVKATLMLVSNVSGGLLGKDEHSMVPNKTLIIKSGVSKSTYYRILSELGLELGYKVRRRNIKTTDGWRSEVALKYITSRLIEFALTKKDYERNLKCLGNLNTKKFATKVERERLEKQASIDQKQKHSVSVRQSTISYDSRSGSTEESLKKIGSFYAKFKNGPPKSI